MHALSAFAAFAVVAIGAIPLGDQASDLTRPGAMTKAEPQLAKFLRLEVFDDRLCSTLTTASMPREERERIESSLASAWVHLGFPADRALEMVRDELSNTPPAHARFAEIMMIAGSELASGGSNEGFTRSDYRRGSLVGFIEQTSTTCHFLISEAGPPGRTLELSLAGNHVRRIIISSPSAEAVMLTQAADGSVALLSSMNGATVAVRGSTFSALLADESPAVFSALVRPLGAIGVSISFSPATPETRAQALAAIRDPSTTFSSVPGRPAVVDLLRNPGFLVALLESAAVEDRPAISARLTAITKLSPPEDPSDWWPVLLGKK